MPVVLRTATGTFFFGVTLTRVLIPAWQDIRNKPTIPDQELVQDWVAAILVGGSGVSLIYDDAAGTLTINASGGGIDWGEIGGTLSDQTDLQTALDGKLSTSGGQIDGSLNVEASLTQDTVPVVIDTDPRLSDARTPLAHNQDASTITTGTLDDARLSTNATLLGNATTGTGSVVRETSPTLTTPTVDSVLFGSFARINSTSSNNVRVRTSDNSTFGSIHCANLVTNGFNVTTNTALATAVGTLTGDTGNNVIMRQGATTGSMFLGILNGSNTNGGTHIQCAGVSRFFIGNNGRSKQGASTAITDLAQYHIVNVLTNYAGLLLESIAGTTADYLSCRNSGSSLEFRVTQGGNVITTGTLSVGTFTVSTLPSASANAGREAQVTDSSVTTYRNTVAGGGANRVKVFSDGTNWLVN